jgi:hypothetical protein
MMMIKLQCGCTLFVTLVITSSYSKLSSRDKYKLVGTNYTMSFNMLHELQFEQICALINFLR